MQVEGCLASSSDPAKHVGRDGAPSRTNRGVVAPSLDPPFSFACKILSTYRLYIIILLLVDDPLEVGLLVLVAQGGWGGFLFHSHNYFNILID